jgi:predicted Zn finger-like uncharacterized protein
MTDSFVTQCPHCQTSFRVSHTQLSVARGVVRCGACLQVFNAARQLLEQSAAKGAEPPALPAERRQPAISQREWAASEVDLDQFDFNPPQRVDSLSASRDEAEHLDPALPPVIQREPPLADEPLEQRTEPSLSTVDEHSHDDAPLTHLHDEDDDQPSVDGRGRLSALDEHDEHDEPHTPIDEPPPRAASKGKRSEPAFRDEHLHDLIDEPLQLEWEKPPATPWSKRLLWLALTVMAAVALAGQYVTYHFAELARQDQYRPIFQQLCPIVGCSVPAKVDIALIKSSNLVVRSHPDFAGALVVDAIIYNRAAFSQPFPLLELRFADLNGQLIASRRFKPAEYLSGDLAGRAEMPPQTPIHIALDILDPGAKAVNYSLSFRSPD